MDQPSVTCPHCGAMLKIAVGNSGSVRCEYCDNLVRVRVPTTQVPQQPARAPQPASPVSVPTSSPLLPAELNQLRRPKVAFLTQAKGFSLFSGLVLTLFSLIFPIIGIGSLIKDFYDYNRLTQEGITVKATVTKLEIDDSGDSTSYMVNYQFAGIASGDISRFDDSESVSSSLYRTLEVGQKIDILYAASDPSLSKIKAEFGPPGLTSPLGFICMGSLFVLIGVAMLYFGIKARSNLQRLRAEGRQAQAVLFDRWTNKDSDGDTFFYVAFAFKIPSASGGEQIITHAEQNRSLYDKHKIGDVLSIRYLPDNPSVCQA